MIVLVVTVAKSVVDKFAMHVVNLTVTVAVL